jgi:hypothetical protein
MRARLFASFGTLSHARWGLIFIPSAVNFEGMLFLSEMSSLQILKSKTACT